MTSLAAFEVIYTLLVDYCGAPESERQQFVLAQVHPTPPEEWRFQGWLGHGGKFLRNRDRFYVTCYPEDETPRRRQMMDKANAELTKFKLNR